jgi:hypothetical protein
VDKKDLPSMDSTVKAIDTYFARNMPRKQRIVEFSLYLKNREL